MVRAFMVIDFACSQNGVSVSLYKFIYLMAPAAATALCCTCAGLAESASTSDVLATELNMNLPRPGDTGVPAPAAQSSSCYSLVGQLLGYIYSHKKKKNVTSFGQPTRLITCANHGNDIDVTCS